ncbi:MAG TPA: NAD(P)H-hydrate dehydratase, partial [Candidatus Limnocylindrales bacterium]|nr:NAD(P)H-hydrate dehydratase [Candidatus Limnocylindrales bacterium]
MSIPILSAEALRAVESKADQSGLSYAEMMERAGTALAERLAQLLAESGAPQDLWRVTFLVGPGNNGGDGLVAGRQLAAATGAGVRFYLLKARAEDDLHLQTAQAAGLQIALASDDQRFRVLQQMVSTSLIVVDALFGIGARAPFDASTRKLLKSVTTALNANEPEPPPFEFASEPARLRSGRARVLAVDCPSGLDCDTGAIDEAALCADETMTMIAAKPGLFRFPGAAFVGRLSVASLGVAPATEGPTQAQQHLVTSADVAAWLPERAPDGHKGTYGRVLIVGGSANYTGAPALAARAAYRMGAGLVTVGAPAPLVDTLAANLYEATWLHLPHDLGALVEDGAGLIRQEAPRCDALVMGMGMGREPGTHRFLADLLAGSGTRTHAPIGFTASAPTESSSKPDLAPLVIDADALSMLADLPDWPSLLPPGTILTPHPGEMARLCGLSTQEVIEQRWELARTKAADWGVTLVLKGAHTLIASPDGTVLVLPFKTSALATAGTGDVLAG